MPIRNISFYVTLAILRHYSREKQSNALHKHFLQQIAIPLSTLHRSERLHSYCACNACYWFTVSLDTGRVFPSSQARDIDNRGVHKSFEHRGMCQRVPSTRNRSQNPSSTFLDWLQETGSGKQLWAGCWMSCLRQPFPRALVFNYHFNKNSLPFTSNAVWMKDGLHVMDNQRSFNWSLSVE